MEEVKVIGIIGYKTSPFVYRVTWALNSRESNMNTKKKMYTTRVSCFSSTTHPVHKKVPVFVHVGKPVVESSIILEYIDETWPQNPLLPTEPYARAMTRFWTKFMDDKVPIIYGFFDRVGEEQIEAVEEARECLRIIEQHCPEEHKLFDGDKIGMTDLFITLIKLVWSLWWPISNSQGHF